ncbi:hypothetical protein KY320_04195 [Candidatus Woesearchaeota archaeon]|nr:hypothetical protein [Candidatus Woesearchaeota archaeon]
MLEDRLEYRNLRVLGDPTVLVPKLLEAEVGIVDHDDSIGRNRAKKLPFEDMIPWNPHNRILNPWFWHWVDNTAYSLASHWAKKKCGVETSHDMQKAEEEAWKEYYGMFLKDNEAELARIESATAAQKQRLLFPGVEDFFGLLPDIEWHIVTRNIDALTKPFSELGFAGIETEVYDKNCHAITFIQEHPEFTKYILVGDEEALSPLHIYQLYLGRQNLMSVFVSPTWAIPRWLEGNIDFQIKRDYTGLVELISANSQYPVEAELPLARRAVAACSELAASSMELKPSVYLQQYAQGFPKA